MVLNGVRCSKNTSWLLSALVVVATWNGEPRPEGSTRLEPQGEFTGECLLEYKASHWIATGQLWANSSSLIEIRTLLGRGTCDEDMLAISGFRYLKELSLWDAEISDAGLRALRGDLPLVELTIFGQNFGFVPPGSRFEDAYNDPYPVIVQCTVGDVGMRSVARFKSLKRLDLAGCLITDEGLKEIGRCRPLEELRLGNTQVTDDGIRHLAALSSLRVLVLHNTFITDTGAAVLLNFRSLREVDLSETMVTEAMARRVATAVQAQSRKP